MNPNDHRTKPESEISFYVFEDLRYQQNKTPGPVVYRYDDLNAALNKYREIPTAMTPALGMHLSERSELDLIHRREGEHVLVTDYLNFSDWRTSPEVLSAIDILCEQLSIDWQLESKCMGSSILIPLERGFDRIPDRCFADKQLQPQPPSFLHGTSSPYSAITEGYVPGEGWIPYQELCRRADAFGWRDPHCVKIERFNITYLDAQGHTGQADISPLDLQILQERYRLRHGDEYTVNRSLDRLCEEVAELVVTPGPDRTAFAEQLKQDFRRGDISAALEALETLRDYGHSDQEIAGAIRLLARITGIPARKSLSRQIDSAQQRRNADRIKEISPPSPGITEGRPESELT